MADDIKIKANVDGLEELMRSIKKAEKWRLRVGILGKNATAIHDSESGLTNAQLGAIHEFGANINHPGGTPYKILGNGKARFVKKSEGEGLPVTKAHKITIPARSFLYQPLSEKLSKIDWKKKAWKDFFVKFNPQDFYDQLASNALHIVQGAFEAPGGYGHWKPLTAATLRRPRGSNWPLVDTGSLKGSITTKVLKR